MLKLKTILLVTLIIQVSCLRGQQFSTETNDIYINTKKIIGETVKLPVITWVSPSSVESITEGDSVELIAGIYSGIMLKSVKIEVRFDNTSLINEFPLAETSFAGDQRVKKKIRLSPGKNIIELSAQNIYGGRVGSKRIIEYSDHEILEGTEKNGNPLLFVKENSVVFTDSNTDGVLYGNEEASIAFVIGNRGRFAGRNLRLSYSMDGSKGDVHLIPAPIPILEPGDEKVVSARVAGGPDVVAGKVRLSLVVTEPNGFDSDSIKIQFNTEAFKPPVMQVADVIFSSVTGNTLKRNMPAGFQVLIQNTGQGIAEEVKVSLEFPENIFFDGDKLTTIGSLASGEAKKLEFEFIPTSRYKYPEIPVKIIVSEKFAKYGSERVASALLDQVLTTMQVNVASVANDSPKKDIIPVSLRSDVDINIPTNPIRYPKRYALVIGNEDYVRFQPLLQSEQNVAFARNDAAVFRDYLVKTAGVPEENAFLLMDATRGMITREMDRVCQLAKLSPESEVVFYYAGHGLPDLETRKGYIIPVDVSGSNLRDGISLADLYAKLASTQAKRISVFIDACFSGGGRGENGLLAARTVKVKPAGDLVDGNIVVFTATSSEEVSLPFKKQSHGLFTYYLLRKFKDTSGNFTFQELNQFLGDEVPRSSLVENGMKQTPQILVSPKLDQQWLTWKF